MTASKLYFAYGSNLLHQRLKARTPSAQSVATGYLKGHQLRFHKIGTDASAKADAFATGDGRHRVHGVLYRLDPRERATLDRIEGVGRGYDLKDVSVHTPKGVLICFSYLVMPEYMDPGLLPFGWYRDFVLWGARQNGFPQGYIRRIAAVPVKPDPDPLRAERNRAILAK